jgi:hypothetical protein
MTTPSMTTPAVYDRPVRLSRRSSQGIFIGLDVWASSSIVIAIAIAILASFRDGFPGFAISSIVWAPLAIAAFIPVQGMPAAKMAALWLAKQLRATVGGTRTRFRPERPRVAATLNLPGKFANVQLWDGGSFACAYNPMNRTVSITAELEVDGFLMMANPERFDLSQQWAQVLASFTQRPGIKRVSLQERTVPTTIRPARQHFDEVLTRRAVDGSTAVADNYREVMDISERFAVSHRNYLTLTLDLVALQSQLKSLGGGKAAVLALAKVEAGNVASALAAANLNVRRWLNAREWGALARTAFDPDSLAMIQNRHGDHSGVAVDAIGPMAFEEPRNNNGVVRTEGSWHSTMWIHEWPRSMTQVGFIEPIVFARDPSTDEAITHIFTLVLTPVTVKHALKRIRTEKKVWRGNQRVKARRNENDSAEDRADWQALDDQEESIVQGHGEYRYGGYLTVTAPTEKKLASAIAGIRNSMSRVGMEGQILYCQQAEALLLNAMPLGMGLK